MSTTEPATWLEAADIAASSIFICVRDNPRINVEDLRNYHDKLIDDFFAHPGGEILIARWATLGSMAIELSEKNAIPVSKKTLVHTLGKKQHDYGPNNILRFAQRGLMIRVWDKISRLDNLDKKDYDPVVQESRFDTMLDIAGYATIGIMLERGWFRLPL